MADNVTRRDVLKTAAATGAALAVPRMVFAESAPVMKIGVIGCGGRGSGAVADHLAANPTAVLHAMADVFPDRLAGSHDNLKKALKDRIKVADDMKFTGFDAYKKLLKTDVDLVILATPPGFRPWHLEAAVDAGKHIFMEKPVAVDGYGIQKVIEASEKAKAKGLGIVAGTQRRHDLAYNEVIKRVHDGQIGDIVEMSCYWNQGGLWMNPRQPNWSDMEWQLRNWLYFTWLSGDHIVEQHIHNIDVCLWAKGSHPVKATALGGRQTRVDPAYGHIYDHFAVEYTFADGSRMHSYCRQQDGTPSNVSERINGTKGVATSEDFGNVPIQIMGSNPFKWESSRKRPNPYMLEHLDLYNSIVAGKPLNEGRQVAESTMTAILGRLAAYSGQEITWEQAMATKRTMPEDWSFGHLPVPAVALPGSYKVE
ncbi:MAG: Gfo/Idh/MocA family oxidoreductase [Armatimonadetes bacterium]|nr:Gfo/Idh/MocA family oxidoreductase [Armatimonadota bacterium]